MVAVAAAAAEEAEAAEAEAAEAAETAAKAVKVQRARAKRVAAKAAKVAKVAVPRPLVLFASPAEGTGQVGAGARGGGVAGRRVTRDDCRTTGASRRHPFCSLTPLNLL